MADETVYICDQCGAQKIGKAAYGAHLRQKHDTWGGVSGRPRNQPAKKKKSRPRKSAALAVIPAPSIAEEVRSALDGALVLRPVSNMVVVVDDVTGRMGILEWMDA